MERPICLIIFATFTGVLSVQVCPSTWFEVDGVCMKFYQTYKKWQAAESECRSEGGFLATVNSLQRHQAIQKQQLALQDTTYHWIGGTDILEEGRWIWTSNNESVNEGYHHWYRGFPTYSKTSNCLALDLSYPYYFWNAACDRTFYSICETEKNNSLTAQVVG